MIKNKYILAFEIYLKSLGVEYVREHTFHPDRKWRFDFAIPKMMLAIEIDGGIYSYGRHNRASGFIKDAEKFCQAALLGWRVIRIPSTELGVYMEVLKEPLLGG